MDGGSSCIKRVDTSSFDRLTTEMAKTVDNETTSAPTSKTGSKANASSVDSDKIPLDKKISAAGSVKCDLCSCEMSSDVVLTSHINGSRHKKRMKALEIVAQLKAAGEKGVELGPENTPNAYRCEVCCLTVNSPQQLEIHLSGAKHRSRADKTRIVSISDSSYTLKHPVPVMDDYVPYSPPPKKKRRTEKILCCDVCDITLNSQLQYEQHVLSRKHMNRAKAPHEVQKRGNKIDIKTSFVQGFLCLSKPYAYKRKLNYK